MSCGVHADGIRINSVKVATSRYSCTFLCWDCCLQTLWRSLADLHAETCSAALGIGARLEHAGLLICAMLCSHGT